MYNGNSRFNDLGNGTITELISDQTQLFYDPTTQQCRAIFNGAAFMPVTKADQSVSYVALGNNNDILHVDLTSQMTRCLGKAPDAAQGIAGDLDPVTGADLSQISVYGILTLMKRAYDIFHNENYAAVQQAIADANAAAAASGGDLPPP